MAIEIVDFPINSMVILPDGSLCVQTCPNWAELKVLDVDSLDSGQKLDLFCQQIQQARLGRRKMASATTQEVLLRISYDGC